MNDTPFFRIMKLLGEAQTELSGRNWTESHWDRCTRAAKLREDLWSAICDYRDVYSDIKVPS